MPSEEHICLKAAAAEVDLEVWRGLKAFAYEKRGCASFSRMI